MSSLVSFALVTFGSLFSIVDPFAAVPMFLALTSSQSREGRLRTAARATATCFLVLTAFAAAGTFIFSFFGITLPAFKISGGILLFGVGLEMMRAKRSDTRATNEEAREAESKEDVGIIPMGLPLLAGPGAIATVMVLVGKAKDVEERGVIFAVIVLVSAVTLIVLRSATGVARIFGTTGLNIIGRVMGLILSAVAMQFVIDGIHEAFPHLLGR